MAEFRVEQVLNPQDFLQEAASLGCDDCGMNFALGPLADSFLQGKKPIDVVRKVYVVYRGDALVLAFVGIASMARFLCTPRAAQLNAQDIPAAMSLLTSALASAEGPEAVDKLSGRRDLVDAFIDAWIAELSTRGIDASGLPPTFPVKSSYASLATLPQPVLLPPGYRIEPATDVDVDTLTALLIAFASDVRMPQAVEIVRPRAVEHIACGEAWMCLSEDGEPAAACVVGRASLRTIAIRSLYVAPAHRRKGLARAFVTSMTRYFLGAEAHGIVALASPSAFEKGVKEEVCICVQDDYVEEIYAKCGFQFAESPEVPWKGEKSWFPLQIRAVKVEQGLGESAGAVLIS
ncbi:GNAT family N-acetyltransferase [Phanerochaete sordida]|uniref:GNAT family N-acetyltransferase n=1 Tax=Phanerochaete sordida TaxID=48140 RepID=A0A9P3G4N3_9APHY|nr:GNAT family N-acetyltransferase [Phanerochaete sordida]